MLTLALQRLQKVLNFLCVVFQSEFMCLEENFYVNRWCRLFWSTVRLRGILQFWHCESWKSFNTAVSNGF